MQWETLNCQVNLPRVASPGISQFSSSHISHHVSKIVPNKKILVLFSNFGYCSIENVLKSLLAWVIGALDNAASGVLGAKLLNKSVCEIVIPEHCYRTFKQLWRDQHLSPHTALGAGTTCLTATSGRLPAHGGGNSGHTGSLVIALSSDQLHWAFHWASGGPSLHTASEVLPFPILCCDTHTRDSGWVSWLRNPSHASFG